MEAEAKTAAAAETVLQPMVLSPMVPMVPVPPELVPLVSELMAQAQVPLSAASLEGVEEAQRDALLGERLYALLSATHAAEQARRHHRGCRHVDSPHPNQAGRSGGMLPGYHPVAGG